MTKEELIAEFDATVKPMRDALEMAERERDLAVRRFNDVDNRYWILSREAYNTLVAKLAEIGETL